MALERVAAAIDAYAANQAAMREVSEQIAQERERAGTAPLPPPPAMPTPPPLVPAPTQETP